MNISLTPELEKFVADLVKGGMYITSSEVIRDALRALKDREEFRQKKLEELKAEIHKGEESIKNEPLVDGPAFMKELTAKYSS